MSHVDEGMVHAYLDDALGAEERARIERHVAECAECAALLREEEQVRTSATSLLMRAAPEAIPAPPFAHVQVRSAGAVPAIPRARPRVPRLAWAAMLVIGLGSAVITARNIRLDVRRERMDEAAPANAPAPAMPASPQAAQSENAVQSESAVQSEMAAKEGLASAGGAGGGARSNTAAPSAATAGAPANQQAPQPAPAGVLAERDAAAEPALSQQRTESRELAARQRETRNDVAADAMRVAGAADDKAAAQNAGAAAAAPAPPPVVAPAPPPAVASGAAKRQSAPSAYAPPAAPAAVTAWRPGTQAEAEELLGAPLARVRGLALLSVEVLPAQPPIVRVRQPLGAVVLELTQQRVLANLDRRTERAQDAASLPRISTQAAEGGVSGAFAKSAVPTVTLRRGDVLITAQAPLSTDSLSALLRRIE